MICTICQGEKSPYEFPSNKNRPLVCFDCNGDVECVGCNQHKHPLEFRVMGKICTPCKIATGMRLSAAQIERYELLTGVAVKIDRRPAKR